MSKDDVKVQSGGIYLNWKTAVSAVVGLILLGINIGGFIHLNGRVETLEKENKELTAIVKEKHAQEIAVMKSNFETINKNVETIKKALLDK